MAARRMLTGEEYARLFWGVVKHECGRPVGSGGLLPSEPTGREHRGLRALVLITLLGECGLRVGEAVTVRWSAVDGGLAGEPVFLLGAAAAKGRRSRHVVLTPIAAWVLTEWRAESMRSNEHLVRGYVLGRSGARGPYTARAAQLAVQMRGRRHLGCDITPHTLRRTFGERCRQHGDLRLAQLMLGHRRLASTERYLGGSVAECVELAARISGDVSEVAPAEVDPVRWAVGSVLRSWQPAARKGKRGRS